MTARSRRALALMSGVSLAIGLMVAAVWAVFATARSPGRVMTVGRGVAVGLDDHTVSLTRITPIPLAVGRRHHPGERGPFFRADPILAVPYALIVAMSLVAPGAWLASGAYGAGVQARRVAAGRCGRCGYDLRGSPQRCPECGTRAAAGPAGAAQA